MVPDHVLCQTELFPDILNLLTTSKIGFEPINLDLESSSLPVKLTLIKVLAWATLLGGVLGAVDRSTINHQLYPVTH